MGSPGRVVLGAACMRCSHDKERNLQKYEAIIEEAAARRVNLLVFPEVSVQGYVTQSSPTPEQTEYYMRQAEPVPGPTTRRIGHLAQRTNMVIQIGMAECNRAGTVLFNSAVLVGPDGVIGTARKVHNRIPIFRSGTSFPVFDTYVGRIGPFICVDLNFPEHLRALAVQGAQVLTMSTAYPLTSGEIEGDPQYRMYDVQSRAAAMCNGVWMAQSNQVQQPPTEGAPTYFGHSRIISPLGEIVAGCGFEECLVTAEVDLISGIEQHRRVWSNYIQRRRPELYHVLVDPEL